jgi:hypothetical protein
VRDRTDTGGPRDGVRRAQRALGTLGALLLCATAAPGAARADHGSNLSGLKDRAVTKTIESVRSALPSDRAPGLMPSQRPIKIKVTSCKQRIERHRLKGFKCAWNAHGELPGRVLLRSNGVAKVDGAARRAKVEQPIENLTEHQAPLLARPHDVSFGYFEDFTKLPDLYDEASPEATGSDIVREGITWKVLQPVEAAPPSKWKWADFDEFYAKALATGLRPIFTFRNAPCWAALAPCDENAPNPPDPSHYDEFAYAAAQIAARYPEAYAIELFFEPNNANMWGRPPDPVAFSTAVGMAADAVHAVPGNTIRVYSGGLAPGEASSDKYFYGRFIADALDAGGVQRADVIAFHAVTEVPYKPGMDPTESYLGRLRIQAEWLRSAIRERGLAMPIAFTQLSYSTGDATYPYTEAQQAEALTASYELTRYIPDTESVIVSHLYDAGDGSKVEGFGVLRADRSPKPAYCGLARARGVNSPPGC